MLFEMVNDNILLTNSMLRQSVILVTKDASNITQSDLQYAVTKIVTTVQCKLAWFNVKVIQQKATENCMTRDCMLYTYLQKACRQSNQGG